MVERELIDNAFDGFFDFPTEDRTHVTSVSCRLFAEHVCATLMARIAELEQALRGFLEIVADSKGVAGYHLNGDIAEWDSFQEVEEARKALGDK